MNFVEVLKKIFLIDLFKGLFVTFRHQNPDDLVTEQYPLERSDDLRPLPRAAAPGEG